MGAKLLDKKVAIIVAHEFEDIELLFPVLRLNEEGADILVVPVPEGLHPRPQLNDKPVTGRFGHTVPIPVMEEGKRYKVAGIEEISADDVDCLLFPGGYSPDALRLHEPTLALVRAFYEHGKLVTAICHGPWVPISAGIMEGVQATGYAAVRDDLPEFCQEIIEALYD